MNRTGLLSLTFAALIAFALLGCGDKEKGKDGSVKKDDATKKDGDKDSTSGEVKIDGSSTVYPISLAAATEFQKKHPGVKVTVGVSGTGGGFKKFTKGETDVSDASRPILKKEMDEAGKNKVEYVE